MKQQNNKPYIITYCIVLMFIAVYAFKRPFYNWDMIPYMSLALMIDNVDIARAHDISYGEMKQCVPAKSYDLITDTTHPYKKTMLYNIHAYQQVLPFYVVKPLYIVLVYAFYKSGLRLVAATVIVSVLSYIIIGLLLFHWLAVYLSPRVCCLVGITTMLTSPLLSVAKLSTPDCLSALFLFSAMYYILERQRYIAAFSFLMLAVLTRIDNMIPALFFTAFLAFAVKKISYKQYIVMLLVNMICFFCVTLVARSMGWSILFYPSFFQNNMVTFHKMSGAFSVRNFLSVHTSDTLVGLLFSQISTFLLLGVLAFNEKQTTGQRFTYRQLFILTMLTILVVRFLLHSETADRFFVPYYLVTIILLVQKVANLSGAGKRA